MSNSNFRVVFLLVVAVLVFKFPGCKNATETQQSKHAVGDAFVLDSKPASHTTIGGAQDEMQAESKEVVVRGWVDLNAFEGKQGSAVFMLREILDDHGHGGDAHDPSSCPFCKRRMEAAPKAAVAFRDENDDIIKQDVNELLAIEHGDIVIVKGSGTHDKEFKLLKLTASGIYLSQD